jgi:thiamine-phosphate pyrophosphorylase
MHERRWLCYITDRKALEGAEAARCGALVAKIGEAARCSVDFVQLREKDLSGRELEKLAVEAVRAIREGASSGALPHTRLLINSRVDIALATGADGVHLPAGDLVPSEVRGIWTRAGGSRRPVLSVACHTEADVQTAAEAGADFAVLAPVFGKKDAPGVAPLGVEALRAACRFPAPVVALGGVTLRNAQACLDAGAAGIAAIRLFQENDIAEVVRALRG